MPTFMLHIIGKVQGVYYRQRTKQKALALGIRGYVKNLPDRSVEILAIGDPEPLSELIKWCQIGPPAAIVQEVKVNEVEGIELEGFEVRY